MQSDRILTLLQEIAAQLGKRRAPLLRMSNRAIMPMGVGFGRPAVILPASLVEAIRDEELRHVLVHEVAHLARGDQRTALLQAMAGALYWPIVPVHGLNSELRRAREEICDNAVLAGCTAISYGKTLLRVAELLVMMRPMCASVGMFDGRGKLEKRSRGIDRSEEKHLDERRPQVGVHRDAHVRQWFCGSFGHALRCLGLAELRAPCSV